MTALHPLAGQVEHPAPLRHTAPIWRILIGLFAAPGAWSLQLLASYALEGDRCGSYAAASSGYHPAAIAFGVAALAVASAGLWSSRKIWDRSRSEAPGDRHAALSSGNGRTRFLGLCGLVSSTIFLTAILFETLVPFMVPTCAAS